MLVAAQFASTPTAAQQRVITVLIDARSQQRGARFILELRENLPASARDRLVFEQRIAPPAELPSLLLNSRWEMAVLSNSAIASFSRGNSAIAFEMPFVFSGLRTVIEFQQSSLGQAALNSYPEQNWTGLVYLNSGSTLVAGRQDPKSPNGLKGQKIAVMSQAQAQSVQAVGSAPVQIALTDRKDAVLRGAVDSVTIASGNSATWNLSDGGYLLVDSLSAQVSVVVTHDKTWNALPFIDRAMIGDAAIAATQRADDALAATEEQLYGRARSARVSLVNFSADDKSRAALQWIATQPEPLRGTYSAVINRLQNAPQPSPRHPLAPGKGGQAGKIYFATTREDTGESQFIYRFSDVRTDLIKCGEIESTATGTMSIIGSVMADNAKCGDFLNKILHAGKRALIFVHGFNNRFSEAVERGIFLRSSLGDGTNIILWSWPSKRDGPIGNYRYDKESVGGTAQFRFIRLLKALKAGSESSSLSILAHSMGAWHTVNTLRELAGSTDRPRLHNVILAAPDIPKDEFQFAFDDVSSATDRMTLYACAWDWALSVSQDMNAFPRAGTGGANVIFVAKPLESVEVGGKFLSTNHSYVFEAGSVLKDLTAIVQSDEAPKARGLLQRPKDSWHYWDFP